MLSPNGRGLPSKWGIKVSILLVAGVLEFLLPSRGGTVLIRGVWFYQSLSSYGGGLFFLVRGVQYSASKGGLYS